MNRFRRARELKHLNIRQLSLEAGVTPQGIRNLERSGFTTRKTLPANVTIATAISLCEVLWPELELADFVESKLKLMLTRRS